MNLSVLLFCFSYAKPGLLRPGFLILKKSFVNTFLKMNGVADLVKKDCRKALQFGRKAVLSRRVSPTRPAPFELPQGLIAARVEG